MSFGDSIGGDHGLSLTGKMQTKRADMIDKTGKNLRCFKL